MKIKDFIKTKFGFVVANLVGAFVLAVIAICVLFGWLRNYTQHGVEVQVPVITGLQMAEAEKALAEQHLVLIVVDSTFSNDVPLGTIVEQTPPAGSHAKRDRSVYAMINSTCRRQVELPDLHDISYRQAQSTLRALGLQVGTVTYEPSEYKDIVLEICYGDTPLQPGDKIAEGSTVTMIVGRGKGTAYVAVPNLQGKTLAEARSLLIESYHLTIGLIEYDESVDDRQQTANEEYIVYRQSPASGTQVLEGTGIDIKLCSDIEKALSSNNEEPQDEDFF